MPALGVLAIPLCAQLKILTAEIPNATSGVAYSTTFAASGGTAPYSWSVIGSLPSGLALSGAGTLSGTSTAVGWSGILTIQVADSVAATAALPYALNVAPALDSYGGRLDTTCAAQATFYTLKLSGRWWFCTPAGHLFQSLSVGGMSPGLDGTDTLAGFTSNYSTIATAHYGDNGGPNWTHGAFYRLRGLSFNSVGFPDAVSDPFTSTDPLKLPALAQIQVVTYAARNLNGYWTEGIKDTIQGVPSTTYSGYRAPMGDLGDPKLWPGFHTMVQNFLGGTVPARFAAPYYLGFLGDDTDFLGGFGAGVDFDTFGPGNNNFDPAFMVAVTSPEQTFNPNVSGSPMLYTDRPFYSKAQALNTVGCGITTPCSWRDYARDSYGTIGALNAAWGSSYTSFDSVGTRVTETIGTGNGSVTAFSATLAHNPVSPMSVQVVKAGTAVGGDCPWWNCTEAANTGELHSADSTIQTGSACNVGAPTFDSPGAPYPAATYFFQCVYTYSDSSYGVVGQFQSISVSAGQRPICTSPAGGGSINGWDCYGDCIIASGGASFGCHAAGTPTSAVVFRKQTSGLAIGANFSLPNTGINTGGAVNPAIPSIINYSTGAVTVTFQAAPTAGQAIQISYVYGGWMSGGTGLLDESGSGSWVGTNPWCLKDESATYPGFACRAANPGGFPVVNANATFATFALNWEKQFCAMLSKNFKAEMRLYSSSMPYGGVDTFGTWGIPARKELIQGCSPSLDFIFPALASQTQAGATVFQRMVDYVYANSGKPILPTVFAAATPDSDDFKRYGNSASDKGTQELRGQFYTNSVSDFLNSTETTSGEHTFLGASFWGYTTFFTEFGQPCCASATNWGFITLKDNLLNGKEGCGVTRTDPQGFTTTAETNLPAWAPSTAYAADTTNAVYPRVQPRSGTLAIYQLLSGSGTSGGSDPAWCHTPACTVSDNGLTWSYVGEKRQSDCYGDTTDYVKQGNSLWWALSSSSGTTFGGKITLSGSVTLQ